MTLRFVTAPVQYTDSGWTVDPAYATPDVAAREPLFAAVTMAIAAEGAVNRHDTPIQAGDAVIDFISDHWTDAGLTPQQRDEYIEMARWAADRMNKALLAPLN